MDVPGPVRGIAVLAALDVVLTACSLFVPQGSVVGLEVHNRTIDDLLFVGADGEELVIPACGSASDPDFRIDQVQVRAAAGFVRGFGGDMFERGELVHVIEVASAINSGIPTRGPAPEALPPCEGHAEAQPGT